MPDDLPDAIPWRALQRLVGGGRPNRATSMAAGFAANYGWHRSSGERIIRPTPLAHSTPHLDREVPRTTLQAQRVEMPLFEIASNPTIRLSDIRERRFGLLSRERRLPIVARILKQLASQFGVPLPVPPPPPPERPRRSRYELLMLD